MIQTLRKLDTANRDNWVLYDSALENERRQFIPTPAALGELADKVHGGLRQLAEARRGAPPGSAAEVLGLQLQDVMEVLATRLVDDPTFPNRYVQTISGKLGSLLGLDPRETMVRAEVLLALLEQTPAVLSAAGELAGRSAADRRELFWGAVASLEEQLVQLPDQLPAALAGADEKMLGGLAAAARGAAARAAEVAKEVKAQPPPSPAMEPPRLSYEDTLRRIYGIKLADLVDWHRDEVERCDREFRALAGKLGPGRDPFKILVEDSPPYSEPDLMYEAIERFLAIAKARTLEYITLPPGEVCEVKQVPEHLKEWYPWGGYWGGNALRGDLVGAVFLNRYNYREITRAWIQMNAVHESYPGHHAHFVKTAAGDMPAAFKLGSMTSRGAPLSEGVAHRSETLLQDVFGEPVYPLFVLYRRLHTAVRIWVDLELFHLGGGVAAGVDIYRKYLGFAEEVARGQVLAQRLTPGYFTVYYYGMRELERLQDEIGWDDRRFTELIFSSGKTSLEVLRRLIGLDDESRAGLMANYSEAFPAT